MGGDARHLRLIQPLPLGREIGDTAKHSSGLRRPAGSVDGPNQRFDLHHHARSAAVGTVVDGTMDVGGEVPRIPQPQLSDASFQGPRNDALLRQDPKLIREQRDNVESQLASPRRRGWVLFQLHPRHITVIPASARPGSEVRVPIDLDRTGLEVDVLDNVVPDEG